MEKNVSVLKFGGTSVGGSEKLGIDEASAMNAVAHNVFTHKEKPVVVTSALSGVTDQLLKILEQIEKGESGDELLKIIRKRHEDLVASLKIDLNLNEIFEKIQATVHHYARLAKSSEEEKNYLGELFRSLRDRLQTFGERLSAPIVAAFLQKHEMKAQYVDAFDLIYTDGHYGNAKVDFEKTGEAVMEKLIPLLERGIIPVITGFLGQGPNGKETSLGRGGSDYTASIIAGELKKAGVPVDFIDIFTDVNGVFTSDPRIVSEAKQLSEMSYFEAGQMAYHGGKVLFPKTMLPALRENIRIRVRNTFNGENLGTIIGNNKIETLKAVTCKKGVSIITISTPEMFDAPGFLARLYEVFDKHRISVDVVATSNTEVSSSVDGKVPEELLKDLEALGVVEIRYKQAVISLVGHGIHSTKHVASRFLDGVNGITPAMISFAPSQTNLTVIVDDNLSDDIVRNVHREFFS